MELPLYSNSKQMSGLLVLSLATGGEAVEILGKSILVLLRLETWQRNLVTFFRQTFLPFFFGTLPLNFHLDC